MTVQDIKHTDARLTARMTFRSLGRTSAAGRLIRHRLIIPDKYRRMLANETDAWNEIMAMDEAALDAELGLEKTAAINALSPLEKGETDTLPSPSPSSSFALIKMQGTFSIRIVQQRLMHERLLLGERVPTPNDRYWGALPSPC